MGRLAIRSHRAEIIRPGITPTPSQTMFIFIFKWFKWLTPALVPPLLNPSATSKSSTRERAMRLVVRKLEIPDLGQLQSLVIEHLDGIEPGLTVLDSRLLLGHATVDIVALDADGALVLVTAGFAADEEMLLKAVEAYSWCLEYPDAIRRLYPSVDVSAARPPRLMFVVERMPDAFHRKIKQLGFSEVDCVEFRHLDVSGTPAAYFDTIARLRRGTTLAEFQPAPIARLVSQPHMRRAPEPMIAERPVDKPDHNDKVVPLVTGPSSTRGTSVRLQKMLNSNGQGHGVAPVIDLAARTAASAPRVGPAAPAVEIAAPAVEAVAIETLDLEIDAPAAEIELPEVELPQMVQIEADTMVVEDELAEAVIEAGRLEAAAAEEELRLEIAEPIADVPTIEASALIADVPSVEAAAPITEPIAEAAAPELLNPTPEPEAPVAKVEPVARVTLRDAIAAPAPVVAPTPVPQAAEPRVSFAEIAKELLGGTKAPAAAPIEKKIAPVGVLRTEKRAAVVEKPAAVAEKPARVVEKPAAVAEKAAPAAEKPAAVAEKPAPVVEKPVVEKPAPVVAATAKPVFSAPKPAAPAAKPATTSIKPAAPVSNPVAPAAKPIAPVAKPAVAASKAPAAAKPAIAAPSATPPTAEAAPAAAEPPAQSLPQEFEGLKFPNDGVLTRQWMEFLNQMASSK